VLVRVVDSLFWVKTHLDLICVAYLDAIMCLCLMVSNRDATKSAAGIDMCGQQSVSILFKYDTRALQGRPLILRPFASVIATPAPRPTAKYLHSP